MIRYIKGTVSLIGENYIILDHHDMGFQISMPSSDLYKITEGMEAVIYTHLAVREDDLSLYGFLSLDELEVFRQLITVSGVGPKAALGILSSISAQDLMFAIEAGDAKLIASAKGIGMKTAQKLVVDLKGKFKDAAADVYTSSFGVLNQSSGSDVEAAIQFAQATGLSRSQCLKALSKVQVSQNADIDEIIDLIFRNLSTI